MAVGELLEPQDIMFTNFEPKLKNRFIMQIDGIPAYVIKATTRPQITFETIEYFTDFSVFWGVLY